jgi:hypothetical protein
MTAPAPAASALAKLCRVVDAFRSRLQGDPVVIGAGSAHKSLGYFRRTPHGLALPTVSLPRRPLSTGQAKW